MGIKDKAHRGGEGTRGDRESRRDSTERLFSYFHQPFPNGRKVSQTPESTVWRSACREEEEEEGHMPGGGGGGRGLVSREGH